MSEAEMHHGEALLWIEALEWFIHSKGIPVPTWADIHAIGWKPTPAPNLT